MTRREKFRLKRKLNTVLLTGIEMYMFARISAEYMMLKKFSPGEMGLAVFCMMIFCYKCGSDNREEYEEQIQDSRRQHIAVSQNSENRRNAM